ncbi:MAG: hypothetical protein ACPGYV_06910 [Phycisphaeraceae bacterium]
MRMLGWFILLFGVASASQEARAHLADEFAQVSLQAAIDAAAVDLVVKIPARIAMVDVFGGMSPVEMDKMEPADLSALVGRVFSSRCAVWIDGVVVPPTVMGAVVDMTNSRLPARAFPEPQVLEQGELKFLARYETKGAPRSVRIDWSIYANEYDAEGDPIHSEDQLQVVAAVSDFDREQLVLLTPIEPSYTWHSADAAAIPAQLLASRFVEPKRTEIPLPSIMLVLAGVVCGAITAGRSKPRAIGLVLLAFAFAGACLPYGRLAIERTPSELALTDDQALGVFESLHRNIYRAFDYTDEGAVYDALAQSVDGPMLETIYNDVYASLVMREENGAVSKVSRVAIEEAELIDSSRTTSSEMPADEAAGSFVVRAAWEVDGVVTHFGHAHKRTNAYRAVYTVAPRAEGWRIVGVDILEQRRVDDGGLTTPALNPSPTEGS